MPDFWKKWSKARAALLLLSVLLLTACREEGDSFRFSEAASETSEASEPADEAAQVMEYTGQASQAAEYAGETDADSAQQAETEPVCTVHICGAVNAPGVYDLPASSRVIDAVKAGGGFREDAAQDACNLAQPVTDGSRIYILTLEEQAQGLQSADTLQAAAGESASGAETGLVNINTADAAQLMTLSGIGESRAQAIIDWRKRQGPFSRIEDIMKVSGIKEAAFEKIKDRITV